MKKLQKAIAKVDQENVFTWKDVGEEVKLKLYSQELEKAGKCKILGLWFDERVGCTHSENSG